MDTNNVNFAALETAVTTFVGENGAKMIYELYKLLDEAEKRGAQQGAEKANYAIMQAQNEGHRAGFDVGYEFGYEDGSAPPYDPNILHGAGDMVVDYETEEDFVQAMLDEMYEPQAETDDYVALPKSFN